MEGFGAGLVNSADEGEDETWSKRWRSIATLQGKQYAIPLGNIGRKFVSILTAEITGVVNRTHTSDRIFVLCATVLQREKIVNSSSDIKRAISKRMELWEEGKVDELIQEAIRCDKKIAKKQYKIPSQQQRARVMTRLVSSGRLRDATRWATERGGCCSGLLMPEQTLSEGTTVRDVLQEKHPPQAVPEVESFLTDNLPTMIDVNVTAGHIENAAHKLKGSAGPSGTDAEQWRNLHGAHSGRLRDAVAALTRLLANNIVEWDRV
ncbi:hypothetical protein GE061_013412 [Apolygus lucorum]|uniref:Uncharacterized protein n=1 Tax=Apolygus lucorum TaxID=248454 RepID=A0A8S9XPZ2_APOLU|nr:hypothetical protein GE061_013412 [Apolygus lucorum]